MRFKLLFTLTLLSVFLVSCSSAQTEQNTASLSAQETPRFDSTYISGFPDAGIQTTYIEYYVWATQSDQDDNNWSKAKMTAWFNLLSNWRDTVDHTVTINHKTGQLRDLEKNTDKTARLKATQKASYQMTKIFLSSDEAVSKMTFSPDELNQMLTYFKYAHDRHFTNTLENSDKYTDQKNAYDEIKMMEAALATRSSCPTDSATPDSITLSSCHLTEANKDVARTAMVKRTKEIYKVTNLTPKQVAEINTAVKRSLGQILPSIVLEYFYRISLIASFIQIDE